MIEEARARLGDRVPLEVALMDEYEPPEPVDMTLCLRAFYYPPTGGRSSAASPATRARSSSSTSTRAPSDGAEIERDLRASGFGALELRPFFLPQQHAVPGPGAGCADGARAHRARSRARRCACAASGSARLPPVAGTNLKPT